LFYAPAFLRLGVKAVLKVLKLEVTVFVEPDAACAGMGMLWCKMMDADLSGTLEITNTGE
jgi:hypothetical protein